MEKLLNLTILIIFLLGLNTYYVKGQRDSTYVEKKQLIVKLENGEEYKGEVILESDAEIVLSTEDGEVTLETAQIKKVKEDYYKGRFDYGNPNKKRYFFNSNAISLEKKEGYYQNIYGGINFANYGLTNNISMGGGFEFFSLLNGTPVWYISSKAGFSINKHIHLGGNLSLMGIGDEAYLFYYGGATFGNSDFNITTGVGSSNLIESFVPMYNVSLMYRMNNKLSLISENYFLNYTKVVSFSFLGFTFNRDVTFNLYVGIHGLRWAVNKNTFDFGVFCLQINDYIDAPFFPYVGYSRRF